MSNLLPPRAAYPQAVYMSRVPPLQFFGLS